MRQFVNPVHHYNLLNRVQTIGAAEQMRQKTVRSDPSNKRGTDLLPLHPPNAYFRTIEAFPPLKNLLLPRHVGPAVKNHQVSILGTAPVHVIPSMFQAIGNRIRQAFV